MYVQCVIPPLFPPKPPRRKTVKPTRKGVKLFYMPLVSLFGLEPRPVETTLPGHQGLQAAAWRTPLPPWVSHEGYHPDMRLRDYPSLRTGRPTGRPSIEFLPRGGCRIAARPAAPTVSAVSAEPSPRRSAGEAEPRRSLEALAAPAEASRGPGSMRSTESPTALGKAPCPWGPLRHFSRAPLPVLAQRPRPILRLHRDLEAFVLVPGPRRLPHRPGPAAPAVSGVGLRSARGAEP